MVMIKVLVMKEKMMMEEEEEVRGKPHGSWASDPVSLVGAEAETQMVPCHS